MNFEEDETLNMTTAIQKGLVKTRPSPVKDTMSFSISAVTNPNTGKNLKLLCIVKNYMCTCVHLHVYKFKYQKHINLASKKFHTF